MKNCLVLVLLIYSGALAAASPDPVSPGALACGIYRIQGRIELRDTVLELHVAPGSMSQLILQLPESLTLKGAGYLKHRVAVVGRILSEVRNYRGAFVPEQIEDVIPDPLREGTLNEVKLIQRLPCR